MAIQSDKSVLLIEDHADIAQMLERYLSTRGFEVDYAADGVTGLHLAVSNHYSAIVLDLTLPGMDGLKVCAKLREEAHKDTPVIMLTARDTLEDKIAGLEIGADDYLVKPFAIKELEARLTSLIRRNRGELTHELLQIGDLSINTSTHSVKRDGKSLKLTPTGFKILTLLIAFAAILGVYFAKIVIEEILIKKRFRKSRPTFGATTKAMRNFHCWIRKTSQDF